METLTRTSASQLTKFERSDQREIREYFERNGYVVIRSLLDPKPIDTFLGEYSRIKQSKSFIYYSQSIHRAIRPTLNAFGFIEESMQNASRIGLFSRFAEAIKQCIYHERVTDVLSALDGCEKHVSWQDMFFDLSTGTIEHADTWYLDTEPRGALIAGWFALEDINELAGTFFVMPGSHKLAPLDKARFPNHDDFRKKTLEFVAENGFKAKGMPLAKGDVLFWHPFLIHGAFTNADPRYSRKSFTAHYFPFGAKRAYKKITKLEPTHNLRMYRVKHPNDALVNLFWYSKFLVDAATGARAKMDMRRKSYS